MKMKQCSNTLSSCVDLIVDSSDRVGASKDGLMIDDKRDESALDHVSYGAEPKYDFHNNISACTNQSVLCAGPC